MYFQKIMRNDDPNINSGEETPNFGRYKVIRLLGEGAMGRVYLSADPILKRQVAVKVISTDKHLDPKVLSEYLERFTVEAQACAKLNHPSVVSIYDAGETDGAPWIAFEYVDGERLDQVIARQRQMPFDRIARIAGDIAAAMQHAHNMNIVHRDIKPANILIDGKTDIAKLADFGVVKAPFTTITESGSAVGSPGYMSPEQIDNLPVDARSDIFSFGIALYEMITGTHPFLRDTVQATFYATVSCNYTPVQKLREETPDKLVRIVEKSLVANKKLRIINADELCSMIAGCLDDGVGKTGSYMFRKPKRGFANRARYVWAVVERGAGTGLRIMPPFLRDMTVDAAAFCKEKFYDMSKFCGEKILPFIRDTYDGIYARLRKRFTKTQITIAAAGAASAFAAIVMIALITTIGARSGDNNNLIKNAREKGYVVNSGKALADTARGYLDKCDFWNARQIADILAASKDKNLSRQGVMFKAMATLCSDRFGDAQEAFEAVSQLDGGENMIRREHVFFIRYLENWIERELPESLAELCAKQLFLHDSHQVRVWTKDHHYWIRWNAVNILQRGGTEVDLVPVYILDLEHAASSRTKIRAAEKLGELGDRRAVPALTAVRNNRSNPAASTARRVLRDRFGVW